MTQPYCGKCHKWLDDGIPGRKEGAVCNCRNPDLTKDPNCHNSGHGHYDPESPIVKLDAQLLEMEDKIPTTLAHLEEPEKYVGPLRWRGRLNWKDITERILAGVISGLAAGAAFWALTNLL